MSKENTNSVLGNATNHFRNALTQELKQVEVPEWNSTIYFKVATSFATEKKILDLHSKGEMVEALVETLLHKALDKDGNRVFTNADKVVLMREVDPEVIIRVVSAMQAAKEEAKNSLGN
jgi:hypothetical protein